MLQRVILDVDLGTDDALSILILLFAELLGLAKLEAVTCVNGNTDVDNVVTNVLRILDAAERTDIPVYRGTNTSFIPPEIAGDGFYGEDGFGDLEWDNEPDSRPLKPEIAAMAIGKLVTENPGEIYIVGLGPATNIALAMKLYPTFAKDVKAIYLMGGNHRAVGNISPAAEFNFYMDPEAVSIIFEEAKGLVYLVTWETAIETGIDYNWRRDVLGAISNPVMDVINRVDFEILDPAEEWTPADAILTAAFLYPKSMVTYQQSYPAVIELHGSHTRGQVVLDHKNTTMPNVIVMEALNKEFFMNLLIDVANQTQYIKQ